MSASSVGDTDIHTPSELGQIPVSNNGNLELTSSSHRTSRKRSIHEMIEGEAFSNRLLSHRRDNFHGLKLA